MKDTLREPSLILGAVDASINNKIVDLDTIIIRDIA